jgi:hypothetical protein
MSPAEHLAKLDALQVKETRKVFLQRFRKTKKLQAIEVSHID